MFFRKLFAWRRRSRIHSEIDEEIQTHLAMKAADSSGDAEARRAFGNVGTIQEDSREAWTWPTLESWLQDIRHAFRGFRRAPAFTLITIATLALAIGANTAILTLADALLLRPLPFPDPDRLAMVFLDATQQGFPRGDIAPGHVTEMRRNVRAFSTAGLARADANITGDGDPVRFKSGLVTANFFDVVGMRPLRGRFFENGEDQPGRDGVVILTYEVWKSRYNLSPSIIGQDIRINETPTRVIGILPPGFQFYYHADLWMPLSMSPEKWANRHSFYMYAVGRLRDGVSWADCAAEMDSVSQYIFAQDSAEDRRQKLIAVPVREELTSKVRWGVFALTAGALCVLLIAAANVAGLLLSRAMSRSSELAVRAALGAGSWRLARQLFTENMVLALLGGLSGIVVAHFSLHFLKPLIPSSMTGYTELAIDGRVLAILIAASLLTGILCGVGPAWRMASTDPNLALRQGGARMSGSSGQAGARRWFILGEVALTVVLLIAAGLLFQTFTRLRGIDAGFRADHVLTMDTILSPKYQTLDRRTGFYNEVLERVAALPGVLSVAYSSTTPLNWRGGIMTIDIEGKPPQRQSAMYRHVTDDYFKTFGISQQSGRVFDSRDRMGSQPVAVINKTMAAQFWPGENPVGQRVRIMMVPDWLTIIGVVADVKEMGLDKAQKAILYVGYRQGGASFAAPAALAVRTYGDPVQLTGAIRREILAVNPEQPVSNVMALDDLVDSQLTDRRVQAQLFGAFAGAALLLACIGLYGVISYAVTTRTREFGIRLALGAEPLAVVGLVLAGGMRLVAAGVIIGVAIAFYATRWLGTMLFEIRATDPWTFALAPTAVLSVAVIACLVPAWRTTRIDPLESLRAD